VQAALRVSSTAITQAERICMNIPQVDLNNSTTRAAGKRAQRHMKDAL
jgi:hypothetical protein